MKEINIGRNIYTKRKEKGITQDELAEYMGVSKASVSKWENGQSYPDITFLPVLATYFNISVDELIGYLPQMSVQDVKKLYTELSELFATTSLQTVMAKIHSYLRKYYSCYVLQFYMAVLLVNYGATTSEEKDKNEMLQEAYDICERIVEESEDLKLSNQAIEIQASAALILNQPDRVIMLLEDQLQPKGSSELVLANAYNMKGEKTKADQITKYTMYGHLINLLALLQSFMANNLADQTIFEQTLFRCEKINEGFQVKEFNQNVMAQIYFTAAVGYLMHNRQEEAIQMLENYADVCMRFEFPVRMHTDSYFKGIEQMCADYEIGTISPRNEAAIKTSILQAVMVNPVFEPLHESPRYQSVIQKLKRFIEK